MLFYVSIASGQEKMPDSVKSLAQRMASEREKIVSYKVKIAVESQVLASPDFTKQISQNLVEYYFEFSRLEKHFVSRPSHEKLRVFQDLLEEIGIPTSSFSLESQTSLRSVSFEQ